MLVELCVGEVVPPARALEPCSGGERRDRFETFLHAAVVAGRGEVSRGAGKRREDAPRGRPVPERQRVPTGIAGVNSQKMIALGADDRGGVEDADFHADEIALRLESELYFFFRR